jgi:hypothetical protein
MARKKTLKLEELSKETYTLWPRHLSPGSYDHLLAIFGRRASARRSRWKALPRRGPLSA